MKLEPVAPTAAAVEGDAEPPRSTVASEPVEQGGNDAAELGEPDALLENTGAGEVTPLASDEIERRLQVALPQVAFSNVPLARFVGFIADVTGVPVVIDDAALARAGKTRRTPVNAKLSGTTAGELLSSTLNQAGLRSTIADGQIVIAAGR